MTILSSIFGTMSAAEVEASTMPIKSESISTKPDNNSAGVSKVCSVCGDLALGYNFNAVSCESCKAFFRRNALKDKDFKCPFRENCAMTPVTRRFCQRCRLQKCFAVGMRKEYIMSDEERMNKRQKIEQNRARKRGSQCLNEASNDALEYNGTPTPTKLSRLGGSIEEWQSMGSPTPSQSQLDSLSPQPQRVGDRDRDRAADSLESFTHTTTAATSPMAASPVTAESASTSPMAAASLGSIPSPNSPPESATLAASDNVEMLTRLSGMSSIVDLGRACSGTQTLDPPLPPPPPNALPMHPIKMLRTAWTQTTQAQSQSTPLLTSLISSPTSVREATTSPTNFDGPSPSPSTARRTLEGLSPWVTCLPNAVLPSGDVARDAMQDVLRMSMMPSSIESILSEAIRLEYSTFAPPLALSGSGLASSTHSRELNDAERAKLNELIVANKALNVPIDEHHHKRQEGEPALLDIINLTAVAIRRLIKMTKKISAFKNMCQEDQVALLKGACMEMLILRGAMNYNPEKDTWDLPSSSEGETNHISMNVLKEVRGNLYQEHQLFQRSFDPRWRGDENIMLILSAIALFTPDRACVVHHDVVRLEQNSYYYLLRRYLESTFPGCEARSTFLKLIQKVSELHRLNEEHIQAYLAVDPSEVEPLLIEIFDLKPQQ